jgi:hypothetical protein
VVCKQPVAGSQNGGVFRQEVMDHQYIEGHNIPDRYLQGTLSAAEQARFEEHFIDCPQCVDRLELTEDFRGALRTVAAQRAAKPFVHGRPGMRAWLAALPGGRSAALLAAAVLLLAVLPVVVSIVWVGQAGRQMDQARLSAADWQRKYEDSQQAARKAEAELQARAEEVARQRREIETERERERQPRVVEEGSRQALLQTAPIFDLNAVRGGTSASTTRISIPRSAKWIVLKLETEPDPELQSYRATLFTSDQQAVCRASDMIAVRGALAVSCDSSLFKTGDYRLALEGLTRQGRHVPAGAYSFHVVKQ